MGMRASRERWDLLSFAVQQRGLPASTSAPWPQIGGKIGEKEGKKRKRDVVRVWQTYTEAHGMARVDAASRMLALFL